MRERITTYLIAGAAGLLLCIPVAQAGGYPFTAIAPTGLQYQGHHAGFSITTGNGLHRRRGFNHRRGLNNRRGFRHRRGFGKRRFNRRHFGHRNRHRLQRFGGHNRSHRRGFRHRRFNRWHRPNRHIPQRYYYRDRFGRLRYFTR